MSFFFGVVGGTVAVAVLVGGGLYLAAKLDGSGSAFSSLVTGRPVR